jgi:hypothetical protein
MNSMLVGINERHNILYLVLHLHNVVLFYRRRDVTIMDLVRENSETTDKKSWLFLWRGITVATFFCQTIVPLFVNCQLASDFYDINDI